MAGTTEYQPSTTYLHYTYRPKLHLDRIIYKNRVRGGCRGGSLTRPVIDAIPVNLLEKCYSAERGTSQG
jgi:hypothetical protein